MGKDKPTEMGNLVKTQMKPETHGDYRIFVGAFPTGELAERLQALRVQQDAKTAYITAPHVTLAGTYWRSGPPTPENEKATMLALAAVQRELAPFALTLGGIAHFPPGHRVIYLAVQATDALLAVRQKLLTVLGGDKHHGDKHHHFTPHLTLAMRLSEAASVALFDQLRTSEWHTARWSAPIAQLHLMQRGPEDAAWRTIQAIPLEG
ncbi:MAG: 2'-5' RNA ligase family protein [Caldilineaceae bacterium]